MVYGQSATGTSANTKTLFRKYSEYTADMYNSAVEYFKVGDSYSPIFYTMDDLTLQEQEDCTAVGEETASFECLYDYKVSDDLSIGLNTLDSRIAFDELKGKLGN